MEKDIARMDLDYESPTTSSSDEAESKSEESKESSPMQSE
jgi:hypothetical protein